MVCAGRSRGARSRRCGRPRYLDERAWLQRAAERRRAVDCVPRALDGPPQYQLKDMKIQEVPSAPWSPVATSLRGAPNRFHTAQPEVPWAEPPQIVDWLSARQCGCHWLSLRTAEVIIESSPFRPDLLSARDAPKDILDLRLDQIKKVIHTRRGESTVVSRQ